MILRNRCIWKLVLLELFSIYCKEHPILLFSLGFWNSPNLKQTNTQTKNSKYISLIPQVTPWLQGLSRHWFHVKYNFIFYIYLFDEGGIAYRNLSSLSTIWVVHGTEFRSSGLVLCPARRPSPVGKSKEHLFSHKIANWLTMCSTYWRNLRAPSSVGVGFL